MKKTVLSVMALSIILTSSLGCMKTFCIQKDVSSLLLEDVEAEASIPPQFYIYVAEGIMTLAAAIQIWEAICGDNNNSGDSGNSGDSDNSGDSGSNKLKAVETDSGSLPVGNNKYVYCHEIKCQSGGDLLECQEQDMHPKKEGVCKHS